uniref:Arginine/ornithine antiporter ArcD n=1 Tax=uncultured Thiotrichaceae bacterium TaxID=298394 RepID=A0A6S6T9V8_9GAMM|nr:MAG: Arginine/ornithine antiporter ArcD [uncultured Thiotrichaceae bacterium]
MNSPKSHKNHPLKAALWMLGAAISFTSMAVAGREISHELDTFEIMMYRSFIGIIIVLTVAYFSNTLQQINRQRLGLHFIRNLSHFTGQNLWFYAIALIPLAQLSAFEFSTPLWVALLAPFFLNERLTKVRLLAVSIGFAGILMVAKPGSVALNPGTIAALLCAIGFAGSLIATKLLSRTTSTTCIMFWLTVMQAIFGIICAGFDGDVTVPGAAILPGVFIVGFAGLLAHYCLTTALRFAPAVIISTIDFIRLPIMALVGMLLYQEMLDGWFILGALLVFGGNFLNIYWEGRKKV